MKMSITANDLIRRLLNTSEQEGAEVRCKVIDDYAQELTNSGYGIDQVRKIIVNGIKGYEGRKKKRAAEGRSLRSTAEGSKMSRIRKKLTSKTLWFKNKYGKKSNMDMYGAGNIGSNKAKAKLKELQHFNSKPNFYIIKDKIDPIKIEEAQKRKSNRELLKYLLTPST